MCSKPGGLVMRFSQSADLKPEYLINALHGHERHIRLAAGSATQLIYSVGLTKKSDEELLQGAVPLMEDIVKKIAAEQAKDSQGAVERAAKRVLTEEGDNK